MTRSNSQTTTKILRPDVIGHGLDTVSVSWRGGAAHDVIAALGERYAKGEARPGAAGAYLESIQPGVTVGGFPSTGMVFIEGRLAPILSGDESDRELLPPSVLADHQDAIWGRVCDHFGVALGTPQAGVRRGDLSTDLGFVCRSGTLLLDGLAALFPVRCKVVSYVNGGRTETVNLITPRRGVIVLRAYDKGIEQGGDVPGETIRLERPVRYGKQRQMSPEVYAMQNHAKTHLSGLLPYAQVAGDVRVMGPDQIEDAILDLWRAGDLTQGAMARLIGFTRAERKSVALTERDRRWRRDQRAQLRERGLAVSPLAADDAVLPIPEVLRDVASAWE